MKKKTLLQKQKEEFGVLETTEVKQPKYKVGDEVFLLLAKDCLVIGYEIGDEVPVMCFDKIQLIRYKIEQVLENGWYAIDDFHIEEKYLIPATLEAEGALETFKAYMANVVYYG